MPLYEPTYWQDRRSCTVADRTFETRFVDSDWLTSVRKWRHYIANSCLVVLCTLLQLNPFQSFNFAILNFSNQPLTVLQRKYFQVRFLPPSLYYSHSHISCNTVNLNLADNNDFGHRSDFCGLRFSVAYILLSIQWRIADWKLVLVHAKNNHQYSHYNTVPFDLTNSCFTIWKLSYVKSTLLLPSFIA